MVDETRASLDLRLRSLVDQELDAVEAFGTAVACTKSTALNAMLSALRDQHAMHAAELGARLCEVGGELPKGPDLKRVLNQGKVVMACLKSDGAMLATLKASEDEARASYERGAEDDAMPPPVRALLRSYLTDEQHYAASLEHALERESRRVDATG